MKDYMRRKRIFALLFMVTVFGFSAFNFIHTRDFLADLIVDSVENEKEVTVPDLEACITENLYQKMKFIETYSFLQVLMDKREYNNFSMIKDESGYLHYASFFREEDTRVFEYAMRVKRLKDYVAPKGTQVLFVAAPSNYSASCVKLREGIPANDPANKVNELLFYLNRLDVETLNLGESIPNERLSYQEAFFKTDHHWTIPAAFYGTRKLVEQMEESFGVNLDPTGYYTSADAYHVETYKSGMFGSMGRKTGAFFVGIDDFTALWPEFSGSFHRESTRIDGVVEITEGGFTETLMNPDTLTKSNDLYSGSQYNLYLNEIRPYEKIVNLDNPTGKKILMIRDSYFSPVISFLMPMCGEIHAIWSMEELENLDIESYVKENTFDYIIVEEYPYNIDSEAFNFFKDNE